MEDAAALSNSPRELFILLENKKKNNNLGAILRCAAAFGVQQVVAVGYAQCSVVGSHGASKNVDIVAFPTAKQAVSYLRDECQCLSLIGLLGGSPDTYDEYGYEVENTNGIAKILKFKQTSATTKTYPRSRPVHVRPFIDSNTCIVLSKRWSGLEESLAGVCDSFVHVPFIAVEGNPTDAGDALEPRILDVPSCLSIVFHHFAEFAKFSEHQFKGHKFEVRHRRRGHQYDKKLLTEKDKLIKEHEASEEDLSYGALFGQGQEADY